MAGDHWGISRVSPVECGKATTMADVFKNILLVGKPVTFRHSGVQ